LSMPAVAITPEQQQDLLVKLEALGDAMTAALGPIGILVGEFMKLLEQIRAVKELMAPLGIVIDGMMSVIGPFLNDGLAPLVGIFHTLGQLLGKMLIPLFDIMTPLIEILGKAFVWLYNNVLRHVANAIIWLGNALYNAVAGIINFAVSIINAALGWLGVNLSGVAYKSGSDGFVDAISTDDLASTGSDYLGGGGNNANYTTGRNVTVNIDIFSDVIAGEGGVRELAVMIRDEIRAAEALGY